MPPQSQHLKWEYLVVSCTIKNDHWWIAVNSQQAQQKSIFEYLKQVGDQGWELVSTHVDPAIARPSEIIRLFFKRLKS